MRLKILGRTYFSTWRHPFGGVNELNVFSTWPGMVSAPVKRKIAFSQGFHTLRTKRFQVIFVIDELIKSWYNLAYWVLIQCIWHSLKSDEWIYSWLVSTIHWPVETSQRIWIHSKNTKILEDWSDSVNALHGSAHQNHFNRFTFFAEWIWIWDDSSNIE